ncbi:MAG: LysR family transcriptional regulator [Chloroflexi bacterium]|nr:LysR family transcriptional regulator [Chloroflexota bacterium]
MQMAQIEGFVEAVRSGSISLAAERLYITQPALSARLQGLERDVGRILLVRGRRGVRLTDAGRAFLPYAERGLAAFEEGMRELRHQTVSHSEHLTIGASLTVAGYVLPALLRDLAERWPSSRVTVRSGLSEEVLRALLREEIDLAVHRHVAHPAIVSTQILTDELVLVVHPNHPLGRAEQTSLAELAEARLVLFDRTSDDYRLTIAALQISDIERRGYVEVDDLEVAKRMVRTGDGVSLLPRAAVQDELRDGTLCDVPVIDMPPVTWPVVVAMRKDAGEPTGLARAFLQAVRSAYPRRSHEASPMRSATDRSGRPGSDSSGAVTRSTRATRQPAKVAPRASQSLADTKSIEARGKPRCRSASS